MFKFLLLIVGVQAFFMNLNAQVWIGIGGRLGVCGIANDPYQKEYKSALTGGGYIDLLHKSGLGLEWAVDHYAQESNTYPGKKLSILPLTFGLKFSLLRTEPIVPYVTLGIGDYFIDENDVSSSDVGFHGGLGLNFFFRKAGSLVFEVRRNTVGFNGEDLGGWRATLGLTLTIFPQKPKKTPKRVVRPIRPHPRAVWVPGHWRYCGPRRGYVWIPGRWKRR